MYKDYDIYSPKSIEKYAQSLENKTFRDILSNNDMVVKEEEYDYLTSRFSKGSIGQLVEKYYFGYEPNSNPSPDFEEAGVELKVTPHKKLKNGKLSAKERLVLNIINYEELVNEDFEQSSFWLKNQLILLIHYLYEKDKNKLDYLLQKVHLFQFPEKDLKVIRDDWLKIKQKVTSGKAHELSEGDTNFLGACTKGSSKNSLRSQPYSNEMAMQRAFALKGSYMTTLLRKVINEQDIISFSNEQELKTQSLEELLINKFEPYIGLTPKEIAGILNVEYKERSKNKIPSIISAVLGIKGTKLDEIEEFEKANIEYKTIRLEPNGRPKEHMSFEQIRFDEVYYETWEDSFFRNRFLGKRFMFVIFQFNETESENKSREPYFKGIKFWNMPESILETKVKEVWEEIYNSLHEGVKIEYKKKGSQIQEHNNLPGSDFNQVAHVRPKGANGKDKTKLPDGQMITKQSYWLDKDYITKVIDQY